MAGAWGDDPWRRYAYRWYDERGWSEHVSDGVNEGLDQPGDRQAFAAPSAPVAPSAPFAPIAPSGPVWIEEPATVRVESAPVTVGAAPGSSTSQAPRRWPLAVLGMVASFALGGWIFSGGDDDQPVGVSAVEDVVDSTVLTADVPMAVDVPVVLPTTTALVEPVAPSLPAPVTPPVDPAAAPVTIGTLPLPVSDAERAARNDGTIDPFEKATIDQIFAGLDMPTTTNEELLAIGATLCQAAAASPTQADLEAAILGPLTSAGMSPLRWGFLAGGAGGVMCLDELVRLGIVPTA